MNSRFDVNNEDIIKSVLPNGCPQGYIVSVGSWDLDKIIKETIKHILSYDNVARIILTYKSFSDRSCPGTLIKQTVEKLKIDNL